MTKGKWVYEEEGMYVADFGLVTACVCHRSTCTYKWNGDVRTLDGTLLFEKQGEVASDVMNAIEQRLGDAFQKIFRRNLP